MTIPNSKISMDKIGLSWWTSFRFIMASLDLMPDLEMDIPREKEKERARNPRLVPKG
jgi:hypothetical protein